MCLVDLPTGRVSLRTTDFDIPGLIPLAMKRHYRSTNIWLGISVTAGAIPSRRSFIPKATA